MFVNFCVSIKIHQKGSSVLQTFFKIISEKDSKQFSIYIYSWHALILLCLKELELSLP
jgi:hypothetical protein